MHWWGMVPYLKDMSDMSAQKIIETAKLIVIKVGSALLVDTERSDVRRKWLDGLIQDIVAIREKGIEVILVTSGTVAMGLGPLGFQSRPSRLEEAQAAAAIGQMRLARAYQTIFEEHGITVAQVLLTLDDLEDRPRFLNARNTVETLVERNIIPIINENDTVATSELRFGDNDRLAARVAQMANADCLVLLSDIDGMYDKDPRKNPDAHFFPLIEDITSEIEAMAGPPALSTPGTGGMITKIAAAKIALAGGCSMIIMNGTEAQPLNRLKNGERSTLFLADTDPLTVRKGWIQGMMAPQGFVHIDAGAVAALTRGASLLAAGVTKTEGDFERGDLIGFISPDGRRVGQGLSSYSAEDTFKIQGRQMSEVSKILGYAGRSAVVHRDDLVLL